MQDKWNKLIMSKLEQCSECGGKLEYLGIGKYKCVECGNEMLDDYGKIKEYLWEHGPTPAIVLAKETGVSREKINIVLNGGTSGGFTSNKGTHFAGGVGGWNKKESTAMEKKMGNYTRYR